MTGGEGLARMEDVRLVAGVRWVIFDMERTWLEVFDCLPEQNERWE